ncbi:MAG: GNA1162 family protein [Syntrophales bacterium]
MGRTVTTFVFALALFFLAGCAAKIPHVIVPDYDKRGTRLIAVLPVVGGASDRKSARMLRSKLVEELYFKGYPRIPLNVIDERLAGMTDASGGNRDPKAVGERLTVDAVLYPTLKESDRGGGILSAATAVEAEFELRSARTGEVLWSARHRVTNRSFGFSRKQLELKTSLVYEPVLQEVVIRALETLPDGPDAVGP